MPYSNPEKQREYQKRWQAKKVRRLTAEEREKKNAYKRKYRKIHPESKEARRIRDTRYNYGELYQAKLWSIEIAKEIGRIKWQKKY